MRDFMNALIAKQKYEANLVLSIRYLIPILLILTLCLGFIQYGVSKHNNSLEQKTMFQEVETKMIDQYATYRHYASYGFRVMFLPAPLSIFFTNSTVLQDIVANIESGHRLNIYKPLKGKAVFEINKYLFADFSGILFFFGSLIGLLYGYTAFHNIEYQRFLASITGGITLFFSTLLARAIMLILFVLLFIAAAILLVALNGVHIGIDRSLVSFFMEICGVSIFFLVLGSVFGAFELQIMGFIGAIGSWFSFLFIVPFLVSIIIAAKSDTIKPEYQLEIEKLKMMMTFEKKAKENNVTLVMNQLPEDIHREYILSYYKNEFPKIQKLEEESKTQMQELTNLYYKLSSCFPTTRYLALTNEVSSKGYKTLYVFYESVKQIKEAFFKEYMQKVYFTPQPAKAEPFLKGDDNVFKGKPELPDYYLQGTLFNLLWITVLAMVSYIHFKTTLFELPANKKDAPQPNDIKIKRGKLKSWQIYGNLLNKQLYNLLSKETREFKKKGYTLRVFLDDQELNTAKHRQNFLYLCHPKAIPGYLKLGNFLSLIMDLMHVPTSRKKEIISRFSLEAAWNKKICQLNIAELGNTYLAILELKQFDVYLFDDIGKGMLLNYCIALNEKIFCLWDADSAVLFLTTDVSYVKKEKDKFVTYFESTHWVDTIASLKPSPCCAGVPDEE